MTNYAIRILTYLCRSNGELITATSMAEELGITYQYLMKVINYLRRAHLVESVQGCNGGYRVAKNPERISLYDIVYAMEGEVRLKRFETGEGDSANTIVITNTLLDSITEDIVGVLKRKHITDIS
jgi:Rrf2 family protein